MERTIFVVIGLLLLSSFSSALTIGDNGATLNYRDFELMGCGTEGTGGMDPIKIIVAKHAQPPGVVYPATDSIIISCQGQTGAEIRNYDRIARTDKNRKMTDVCSSTWALVKMKACSFLAKPGETYTIKTKPIPKVGPREYTYLQKDYLNWILGIPTEDAVKVTLPTRFILTEAPPYGELAARGYKEYRLSAISPEGFNDAVDAPTTQLTINKNSKSIAIHSLGQISIDDTPSISCTYKNVKGTQKMDIINAGKFLRPYQEFNGAKQRIIPSGAICTISRNIETETTHGTEISLKEFVYTGVGIVTPGKTILVCPDEVAGEEKECIPYETKQLDGKIAIAATKGNTAPLIVPIS